MNPEVSVIIPAMNEEETIGICIDKIVQVFRDENISGEIVIADSSDDKTPEIARNKGARVVHPDKKGYGNAYQYGFAHANGKILVIGDADNTYDFSIIPELIKPIQQGRADMVIGSRLKGTILPDSMPALHQYIGNPLLTFLLNKSFGTRFSDCHSGMRAITREAYDHLSLHTGGMEYASEMMIEAGRKKLKVAEIPITYYPRNSPSKLHSFADGWRHIRFIMLMRPLPFLMGPGMLFTLLGLFLMAVLIISRPVEYHGLHSFILGGIFLTGGVQLITMGVVLKAYAVTHGFDVCGLWFSRILTYQRLEIVLFSGIGILLLGFISGIYIMWEWFSQSFGALTQVTSAVFALCGVIIGLQLIFTAILSSMMLLRSDRGE
ncbi:MAG TPA: glycosyltransferase [Methanospirillum sp.]|nr:glycosyltransferase [Methanospirillum sp.]